MGVERKGRMIFFRSSAVQESTFFEDKFCFINKIKSWLVKTYKQIQKLANKIAFRPYAEPNLKNLILTCQKLFSIIASSWSCSCCSVFWFKFSIVIDSVVITRSNYSVARAENDVVLLWVIVNLEVRSLELEDDLTDLKQLLSRRIFIQSNGAILPITFD